MQAIRKMQIALNELQSRAENQEKPVEVASSRSGLAEHLLRAKTTGPVDLKDRATLLQSKDHEEIKSVTSSIYRDDSCS